MTTEFVPSAVIEKASLHDMILGLKVAYVDFHSALAVSNGIELLRLKCSKCATLSGLDDLQFKYRLKLQVLYGSTVADVMLFDEAAESLLGVPASKMKSDVLHKYPSLPQLLDELLVGLRVSFSFQRPAPKRSADKRVLFTRDLKATRMEPLVPQLLPEPAVTLAISLLQQQEGSDGSQSVV